MQIDNNRRTRILHLSVGLFINKKRTVVCTAVKDFMEVTINMNICTTTDLLALYETSLMYMVTITEIRM